MTIVCVVKLSCEMKSQLISDKHVLTPVSPHLLFRTHSPTPSHLLTHPAYSYNPLPYMYVDSLTHSLTHTAANGGFVE